VVISAEGAKSGRPAGDSIVAFALPEPAACIHKLSVKKRAVHGASMLLVPQLWLTLPNPLASSRRGGLKAAPPGADSSRMHWNPRSNEFENGIEKLDPSNLKLIAVELME